MGRILAHGRYINDVDVLKQRTELVCAVNTLCEQIRELSQLFDPNCRS
jgi:hypothetical protein